jgi:hypothetical protein
MSMLVVYYSHGGNNRFVAQKISEDCKCDIEEIVPIAKSYFSLLLESFMKISRGIRNIKHLINEETVVVVCGPIWMGQIASPVLSFLKKYSNRVNRIYVVACCGSTENEKDGKFGYQTVFEKIKALVGDKLIKAFPVSSALTVDESKREETNMTEVKLNDLNFTGKIKDQYDQVIKELNISN